MNSRSGGCDSYECRPLLLLLGDIAIVGRQSTATTPEIPMKKVMINQK